MNDPLNIGAMQSEDVERIPFHEMAEREGWERLSDEQFRENVRRAKAAQAQAEAIGQELAD